MRDVCRGSETYPCRRKKDDLELTHRHDVQGAVSGNFLIASAMEDISKALDLAEKNGLDRMTFVNMLTQSFFACSVYQDYGPMIARSKIASHPCGNYSKVSPIYWIRSKELLKSLCSKCGFGTRPVRAYVTALRQYMLETSTEPSRPTAIRRTRPNVSNPHIPCIPALACRSAA